MWLVMAQTLLSVHNSRVPAPALPGGSGRRRANAVVLSEGGREAGAKNPRVKAHSPFVYGSGEQDQTCVRRPSRGILAHTLTTSSTR